MMSNFKDALAMTAVLGAAWAVETYTKQRRAAGDQIPDAGPLPEGFNAPPQIWQAVSPFLQLLGQASGTRTATTAQPTPTPAAVVRPAAVFDKNGTVAPLLDLIKQKESRNNYDVVFAGSKIRPPKPITTMTVAEVRAWQDQSVRAGSASSAAGAYQIIRKTLDGLIAAGVLRRGELFNKSAQDRAAMHLLNRRGLDRYKSGNITAEAFANNIAKEWASFPVVTGPKAGRSHYAGDGLNMALTDIGSVMRAVRSI